MTTDPQPVPQHAPWHARPRTRADALALWAVLIAVVAALSAAMPGRRTVVPTYAAAAHAWIAHEPLYSGPTERAFMYLPPSAALFTPLALMPPAVHEPLWRIIQLSLLAWGLSRLLRPITPPGQHLLFVATLLVLPATLSAARDGQSNVLLAAALAHAAAGFAGPRPWRTGAWLVLALAAKPIALPALALAFVTERRLRAPLAVLTLAFLALPFALGTDPAYVLDQYRAFTSHLTSLAAPEDQRFCDLAGLLAAVGLPAPSPVLLAIRAAAGLGTLAFWILASRRRPEPSRSHLFLTLAAAYLMVFNPMTETNSYVVLAPAVAALALARLAGDPRGAAGWLLVAACILLGVENYGDLVHKPTNFWLKPLVALAVLAYAAALSLAPRASR